MAPSASVDRPAGVGVAGLAVAALGAVMCLLSFTVPPWYGGGKSDSTGSVRFRDLHLLTTLLPDPPALTKAYFGWLAWALLIAVLVVAIAANLPSPAATPLRAAGSAVGLAGVASTYFALAALLRLQQGHGAFHHAQLGVWLALGGFLFAGLGAALGPTRAG